MSLIVPLVPVPSQTLAIQLGGQAVRLNVYQQLTGLYMDVILNDVLLLGGVICENLNRIIRNTYFGFAGDFAFVDLQAGPDVTPVDPDYAGLGGRFALFYFTAAEVAALDG